MVEVKRGYDSSDVTMKSTCEAYHLRMLRILSEYYLAEARLREEPDDEDEEDEEEDGGAGEEDDDDDDDGYSE